MKFPLKLNKKMSNHQLKFKKIIYSIVKLFKLIKKQTENQFFLQIILMEALNVLTVCSWFLLVCFLVDIPRTATAYIIEAWNLHRVKIDKYWNSNDADIYKLNR